MKKSRAFTVFVFWERERHRPGRARRTGQDSLARNPRTEQSAQRARERLPSLSFFEFRFVLEEFEPRGQFDPRSGDGGRRREVEGPGGLPSTGRKGRFERRDAVLADERRESVGNERVMVDCGASSSSRQLEPRPGSPGERERLTVRGLRESDRLIVPRPLQHKRKLGFDFSFGERRQP